LLTAFSKGKKHNNKYIKTIILKKFSVVREGEKKRERDREKKQTHFYKYITEVF